MQCPIVCAVRRNPRLGATETVVSGVVSDDVVAQQPIEIILTRQLASYLSVPFFLVDLDGTMVFYNEPAEELLGVRFGETGEMTYEQWTTAFAPRDERGGPLSPDELPLARTLRSRKPAHATFEITGLDGVVRKLEVTAFPLEGQGGYLGAVALFWKVESD
jgi:PAS domain-containing protein